MIAASWYLDSITSATDPNGMLSAMVAAGLSNRRPVFEFKDERGNFSIENGSIGHDAVAAVLESKDCTMI